MASADAASNPSFNPNYTRNVCIVAHVDHGKTTLSDNLIASNNIISNKSVGKIRYLDSREDEQRRSITMKSSCITLHYRYHFDEDTNCMLPVGATPPEDEEYLINLIDSPGHVDFSSEVSAAVRLCDGALLVVDAVEGISPQTRAVFKQAWRERVKLLLVINKMDRLIVDLRMSPMEAYVHLQKIMEQINAMAYQLRDEEALETDLYPTETLFDAKDALPKAASEERVIEEAVEFSPLKGNVIFCSALHGWYLNLSKFAPFIAQKMNISKSGVSSLCKALWGEYYYHAKSRQIRRKKREDSSKTMFAQFILETIWKVYEATVFDFDSTKVTKIVHSLGMQSRLDTHKLSTGIDSLRAILSEWLPLAEGVLDTLIERLPNPLAAVEYRIPHLLSNNRNETLSSLSREATLVYVAKFLAADLPHLKLTGDKLQGNESHSHFVGFARIFSGRITSGSVLYICGTLGSLRGSQMPLEAAKPHPTKRVTVNRLFLLMGSDLIEIQQAYAGSVVALSIASTETPQIVDERVDVGSLTSVDRCITLSSNALHPPLGNPYSQAASAIIRVSIEPERMQDIKDFVRGLSLLYKADPSVEVQL